MILIICSTLYLLIAVLMFLMCYDMSLEKETDELINDAASCIVWPLTFLIAVLPSKKY
ncbi:MAG: hypothetical protein V4594_16785 [Bacteroidota bacterium]